MTTTQTNHNNIRVMLWELIHKWMTSQAAEEKQPSEQTEQWTKASEELLRAAEVIIGESARGFNEKPTGSTEQVAPSPETSTPTVQATSSYAALEPPRKGKEMSRMMKVAVIVGLVLATLFGYWFATEGYTIQSPISEFNIEFQSPIVAPDSSENLSGSDSGNTDPDFGQYSPPPGSGSNWNCAGPAVYDQANGTVTHNADFCVDP